MTRLSAIIAGVLGALVITGATAIARSQGIPMNMEMMLGSMALGEMSETAWTVGLVIHLMMGGLFGLAYAEIVRRTPLAARASHGALIGLGHGVVSGLMLGVVPMIHPLIPEVAPAPGLFAANIAPMAPVMFIALHIAFGAIVAFVGAKLSETVLAPHRSPA